MGRTHVHQIRLLQGYVLRTGRRVRGQQPSRFARLLDEFGLKRQELEDEGQVLYFFKGAFRTDKDILDPHTQSGAFVPIAKQIRDDQKGLKDERGNWTAHARDLDGISLKDYLESFRHKIKDDWVIDLLDVAYVGENGLETEDQSSLNLVDVIGTDLSKDFQIFGDSDEAWRVEGGSSTLIDRGSCLRSRTTASRCIRASR